MDIEMMRSLKMDAEMLEDMGAGPQVLEFYDAGGNRICESCQSEIADFESKTCVGCDAYRDHTE